MKLFFTYILLHFSFFLFANEAIDSTQKVWHFNGIIQLNNNGISPVPAFSLGKPALMSTFFIRKGNFTFSPEFNYGSDGKPWVVNQWIRFQKNHEKITFRTGANLSLFFRRADDEVKLNQYLALEGFVGYKISEKSSLNLIYWYSHGLDPLAVKSGHFISLSTTISKIPLSKSLFLELRPNLFYLKNQIPFEGIFVSAISSISHKKMPISLFIQGVQPIKVNPSTPFNWNYGINYIF